MLMNKKKGCISNMKTCTTTLMIQHYDN